MTQHIWDAVVIGSGAAGLSAAQAFGRSLRRVLVIDSGSPRNRFADRMHNVLGHDGAPPGELVARGRAEAERYGVEFREGVVLSVRDAEDAAGAPRTVVLDLEGGETLRARALVVATGVVDELPGIPGLAERWGTGVLHCPYCHGWEVRGERLAVVTTSPLGMHQARLLRQWSERLTVFTAGLGELDAATEREFAARGVVLEADPVAEILGDGPRVTGVRTANGREHAIDAVFTASALRPRDGFLAGLALERDETPFGSFLAVDATGRTSHPRVWAAGNVVAPAATIPIAMGAGSMAGAAANLSLVEEEFALAAEVAGDDPGRSGEPGSPATAAAGRSADA